MHTHTHVRPRTKKLQNGALARGVTTYTMLTASRGGLDIEA